MFKKTYLRSGFLKEEKKIDESWLFPTKDEKRHKELLADMSDLSKTYSHPLVSLNPELQKSLLKQFDDKAVELSQVGKRIDAAKKNKKRWFSEEKKLNEEYKNTWYPETEEDIAGMQKHLDAVKEHFAGLKHNQEGPNATGEMHELDYHNNGFDTHLNAIRSHIDNIITPRK